MWRSLLGLRSRCMTLSGNPQFFLICAFCVWMELGLPGSLIASELMCDEIDTWIP